MKFENALQFLIPERYTKQIFSILLLCGSALVIGCNEQQTTMVSREKQRELANVLYNQQLYSQAVEAYVEYLNNYRLDDAERANISYMIANIYFDRLNDYENALAYYLRIKYLYPESPLQADVSKKMVSCLENLRRSVDAQQMVEQTAALDESQKPKSSPGEVIARIGKREVTTTDLHHELNALPVYVRDQIKTKAQKIEFLKNYIAQELLFDSAKRKGLDKEQDVRDGLRRVEKSLMAQKLVEQEITEEVNLDNYTNADVELYFKANKEKYAEKDENGKIIKQPSFAEIQQRVAQDFIEEKQQEAYQRLIQRLMDVENVQIYEQKFN
jgi:peptidyl-prolyl cis-trans isomerase C